MERIYKPLQELSQEEVEKTLRGNDLNLLITLPLSVGEYCSDWKYAQDLCIKLTEHENETVRANAILGLAYIARTKGRLEKHLVKPVLLRELRNCVDLR